VCGLFSIVLVVCCLCLWCYLRLMCLVFVRVCGVRLL